jgi:type VI protein secretion system component VasF
MTTMTDVLTIHDKLTLQTAAHGTVALMAAIDPGVVSAARAGMIGDRALSSATGLTGDILAEPPLGTGLRGTIAELADLVFPALTSSMRILNAKAPEETENFRRTITTAAQATAQAHQDTGPAESEMMRRITTALNA